MWIIPFGQAAVGLGLDGTSSVHDSCSEATHPLSRKQPVESREHPSRMQMSPIQLGEKTPGGSSPWIFHCQ